MGTPEKGKYPNAKIEGVEVRDLNLPGRECELEQELASLCIGQPLTPRMISQLKRTIFLYYKRYHHPVITVLVPEQNVSKGVLQLVVVESHVNEITAIGAHHFSNAMIKKQVHLKPGDTINTDILLRDVAWLNRNPFRQTNVTFAPGSKPWTTDVQLVTRDRRALRVYAGADNTGTEFTGYTRLFTGCNWGNVFNLDHTFSFQWTTSDDLKKFNAFTGSYSAPLPWRHLFNVFGGYSRVKPDIGKFFRSEGWSAQASFRYQIFLGQTYGPLLQDINAGYDFKWTNNNLEFVDQTSVAFIETKVAQISQFSISYHLGYNRGPHAAFFNIAYVFSPFQGWFRHNNKEAFTMLQPGAYPIYMYAHTTLNEEYTAKYVTLFIQGNGQLSNKILLPSEQFGLGGYDTVRGYPQRIVNYDNGVCVNFEVRSPAVSVFNYISSKRWDDGLVALFFIDYGYGRPHKVEHPTHRHVDPPGLTLAGFGPGLRYKFSSYFVGRADCGFPLTPVAGRSKLDPWFYFSVIGTY